MNKQEFSASSWRSNQGYTKMQHGQPVINMKQIVMLTTHRRLAPRLRMNGVIPLLPQCAFMAWAGTTLLFMENKGSLP